MKNLLLLLAILAAFAAMESSASSCLSLKEMQADLFKQLKQDIPQIKPKKQIKIAVIDTGIDYNNPALRANLWMPDGQISASNFGEDLVGKDKTPQDTHGHGTHVSGIIAGIFPEAKIYAINYFSSKPNSANSTTSVGQENLDRFTKAIELAIEAEVDIINISGGGEEASNPEHEVIKMAKRKNILVVSAGGNDGKRLNELYGQTRDGKTVMTKYTYYPAQYNEDNILSVANLNEKGFKHRSSNYGTEIQVGALGKIKSYGIDGECRQILIGTSQSTAVVSALAAMIKSENPEMTATEIKEAIIANAHVTVGFDKAISFSNRSLAEGRSLATAKDKSVSAKILNTLTGK